MDKRENASSAVLIRTRDEFIVPDRLSSAEKRDCNYECCKCDAVRKMEGKKERVRV